MSAMSSVALGITAVLLLMAAISLAGARWVEHEVPPLGHFIEVEGVRLHYVEAGVGPTVILLHGASANLRDMASSLMGPLSQHHRVIAFDRPGYGYSERPDRDWPNPARLADLVITAAERLGAERPVLVGHSWSGSVVMAGLLTQGERLRGGVLLSGVAGHWAGSVGWTYDVGGLPVIGPLFAHTLVFPAGMVLMPGMVQAVTAPNPVPPRYLNHIGARLALRPRTFRHNVTDMSRLNEYMQSLSTRYARIDRPLLVIHGEADELVPFWNHGQRLQAVVRDVQFSLIPDAGHAPHHTHTDAVVSAVETFAASLER